MRTRKAIEQQMELYSQPDKADLYPVAVLRAILETLLDIRDALVPQPVTVNVHRTTTDEEREDMVRRFVELARTLPTPPLDADRQKGRYE